MRMAYICVSKITHLFSLLVIPLSLDFVEENGQSLLLLKPNEVLCIDLSIIQKL